MKLLLLVYLLFVSFFSISSVTPRRNKRTLLPLLNKLLGYNRCAYESCPPWKCQDDSAVIHGFCCHCPYSEYDNVPVYCRPDLGCPLNRQELCADYDFMMECCCTGP